MSRDIKFRAWDKDKQRMGEVMVLHLSEFKGGVFAVDVDYHEKGGSNPQFTDEVVLEQYTGRHDRKGKEIYEGDIDRDDGEIRWSNEDLAYVTNIRLLNKLFEPEIIGNIHENPELRA